MKTLQTRLASLFPRWLKGGSEVFNYGTPPMTSDKLSSDKQSSRNSAQSAAKQEWENEGGSVKTPRS